MAPASPPRARRAPPRRAAWSSWRRPQARREPAASPPRARAGGRSIGPSRRSRLAGEMRRAARVQGARGYGLHQIGPVAHGLPADARRERISPALVEVGAS